MGKLSEYKGYENDILLFAKFTKEKYVKSILEGKLYMNPIRYFVDLENNSRVKGQGDKLEAANVIANVNLKIYNQGTEELVAEGFAGQVIQRYRIFDDIPIFCFTAFESKDFRVVEETEDSYKLVFDIPVKDIEQIKNNFGEKVILLNPGNFLAKVDEYFTQQGIEFAVDKVKYENYQINYEERIKSYLEPSIAPLFTKDEFFKYQREFRIVLFNHRIESNYVVDIGALDDTAFYITDTNLFFGNLGIEISKR